MKLRTRMARRVATLVLLLPLPLFGCGGIGDKVDLLIDQADNEAVKSCMCNWQVNYDSEQECVEDNTVTGSQRGCIEGTFDDSPNDETDEAALDCLNTAFSDLDVCNRDLGCSDDLVAGACYIEYLGDVNDCANSYPQITGDIVQCLGV